MSPDGIRLPEGGPVEQTALWKDGLVEVQDEGSQIIARLCEAQPGQTVIDLCAGGGGKTLALAADMDEQGRLIAADTIRSRLSRSEEHTSELQSLMRISYAVFCFKKKTSKE